MTDRSKPSIRAAVPTDVPAIAAIMAANDEPMDWPDLPNVPGWPYLEYLVSRARVTVAEHAWTVVGFAGSVEVGRSDARFLTDLFVHPAAHGGGSGGVLLDAALDGSMERMTFSTSDDRALGLYIRAGMRPWWPLLYVEMAAGVLGVSVDDIETGPADVTATAGWSRAWTGVERSVDFAHYASLPEAAGFIVRDGGTVAAIGWARRERKRSEGRWLDHATIAPDSDPVRAALAVLHAAAAGDAITAAIPGPHPVVAELLQRGGRIVGRDTFCATDPGLVDPLRLLPNPGFL